MKDPRASSRLFAFAAPLLMLFVLQVNGCLRVDADPETDVNPVGESHTVVAALDDPDPGVEWLALFVVFFGPNEGQNSFVECDGSLEECDDEFIACALDLFGPDCLLDCSPSGCVASGDETISWTYQSNGVTGTDYIAVCAISESIIPQAFAQQISEEELEEQIALLEDEFGCDVVTKDWVEFPDLIISKVCVDGPDAGDADFNVLVTQLLTTIAADALDCNEDLVLADLQPGAYTIREFITGPDAQNFSTSIICTGPDGETVTPGTIATVVLALAEEGEDPNVTCVIENVFLGDGGAGEEPGALGGGVDIDNTNTNTLDNLNDNSNNNENTNTQEQSNFQEQINDNNQTTTVNSSPSVVIDFD